MTSAILLPSTPGQKASRADRPATLRPSAYVLLIQGLFYVVTGVWPLVSMDTFLAVTGPKTDLWLVNTVGVLIAVAGAAMLAGVCRGWATAELVVLAFGSALALIGIDIIYTTKQVIDRVYLLDAAAEAGLVVLWVTALSCEAFARRRGSAVRR